MSTVTSTDTAATTGTGLRTRAKVGLGLAVLMGLGDIVGPFTIPDPKPGEAGPPAEVLWGCFVLGLITVVAAVWMWRTGSRLAGRITAASRVLSALSSVPAFFASGVPAALVVVAGVGCLITALLVFLIVSRPTEN